MPATLIAQPKCGTGVPFTGLERMQGKHHVNPLAEKRSCAATWRSEQLVSQEIAGGDQWYDYAPVTPAAGVATVNGPAYVAGGLQLVSSPGYSYVPVNLLYQ